VELELRYRALVDELVGDGVRLVTKERVWHQRAIDRLLRLVTLGGQSAYLTHYVTTIGRTIYLTPDWERRPLLDRYATLRHEQVHLAQFRRWGVVPMAVAYLLLPFPVGLAWCRMRLERAAYEETLRVRHALGGRAAVAALREHVIRQFTSASYGWMWPFPRAVARWFDRFAAALDGDGPHGIRAR
jgi:hypothetical protein